MPFTETDEFVFDRTEALTLKQHWDIVAKFIELGYDVPFDWLSNTFNIPISGKTEKTLDPPATKIDAEAKAVSFFG
ncbi:hypothetical protein D3C78_1327380 [compost metagenome]